MKRIYLLIVLSALIFVGGCFSKVERIQTNYYVLDYQPSTEKTELKLDVSSGKTLHVFNSKINRTYSRNQIVVKENFYRVRFMNNDLWANRLTDAIPNLITQRLRAYNIFSNVSRDTGETDPDYYLETNVLNIEKIEGKNPRAFLRMEFVMRDSTSEKVIIAHRNERYHDLSDDSTVYLVQVFNNMIMEETNTFAALCIMHFAGRPIRSTRRDYQDTLTAPEEYYFQQLDENLSQIEYGELFLSTKSPIANDILYRVEGLDSLNTSISEQWGTYNSPLQLDPGKYRIITGYNEDIQMILNVYPRQRTVVERNWCELKVRILDQSQSKVRQIYDIWIQNEDDYGYRKVGTGFSLSDDEHGIEEELWILPPGSYMVTLGGYSWSDLKDFTTVNLVKGDSHTLTIVVDPTSSSGNILVGAGVLSDDLGIGSIKFHKGIIHANVNLSADNSIDQDDPMYSLSLFGTFDNTIDHDFRPFHINMRSIYDIGANFSKDVDFRINPDSYSLKNVFLIYPWGKQKRLLNNFAFYLRGDLNTHFWDEYTKFSDVKNYIKINSEGTEVQRVENTDEIRSKIAMYPLRLKEGGGLTYRINFSPKSYMSLRGGYGWQQDLNNNSYSYEKTDSGYDIYRESPDNYSRGIETTLIFSLVNLLSFFSLNSSVDALFPIEETGVMPRIENENQINLRIYRNISLEFKLKLEYDERIKPWWVYNYTSYLRMSLFY
ncbi:MAG: ABC-type transport auxiliary lipoprotein family protein [Candidatus Cloacimonetes bacterium]|nr:ABC-type transport auxiliary lipoprotein family protein [Candidatus Cloacimonadota bacterium]MDD4686808.1 ABC-type transport auxiliary lipoprotein family protein [Candidatus Cloacimonadota bacterium]